MWLLVPQAGKAGLGIGSRAGAARVVLNSQEPIPFWRLAPGVQCAMDVQPTDGPRRTILGDLLEIIAYPNPLIASLSRTVCLRRAWRQRELRRLVTDEKSFQLVDSPLGAGQEWWWK